MKEKWIPIKGYENIYEVSDLGQIRSLDRINYNNYKYQGKILKLSPSKNGYLYVGLSLKGKTKMYPVHKLVIENFIGTSDLYCDHIDNNKHNNKLNNLKYVSHRENMSKFHKTYKNLPTGVQITKNGKRFSAYIRIKGKKFNLGTYDTIQEAETIYNNKLKEINKNGIL